MGPEEDVGLDWGDQVDFNCRVRLEFRVAQTRSDSGLLVQISATKISRRHEAKRDLERKKVDLTASSGDNNFKPQTPWGKLVKGLFYRPDCNIFSRDIR